PRTHRRRAGPRAVRVAVERASAGVALAGAPRASSLRDMATQVGADWPSGAGLPGQHDAFLLALTDAIRSVADARLVMRLIAEHLGQALRADGVGYGEIDETRAFLTVAEYWCAPGVRSLVGRHR